MVETVAHQRFVRGIGLISILLLMLACPAAEGKAKRPAAKASATRPASAPASQAGSAAMRALESYLSAQHIHAGVYAVRLKDGAVLAARDARTPLMPASVNKLATSATVLAVLGSEFRFTTTLATLGEDLVVIGDGDPTFGDPFMAAEAGGTIYDAMDQWAAKLKEAKITAIKGKLVLDESIFVGGRHPAWPKNQYDRWYCCPVAGLNFNNNCMDVELHRSGAQVTADVSPASRFMNVVSHLTAGKGTWTMRLSDDEATVTLSGQVKGSSGKPISTAVNDPGMLFGRVLLDRLARAGITVAGGIERRAVVSTDRERKTPPGLTVIAQTTTPIAAVLARANKRSLNMTAECLSLRAAAAVSGQGTFAEAQRVATAVLVHAYGLSEKEFAVSDGCGLSRGNRISAAAEVSLLRQLAARPDAKVFLSSLSVAGEDGTLRDRFKEHAGRVLGKTGSIDGVSALAGYVLDKDNAPAIAFAFFFNDTHGTNWQAKSAADRLVSEWVEAANP